VVDLAVAWGLLIPDPNSEIGHFAFSQYYYDGKQLDLKLHNDISDYEKNYPELSFERIEELNDRFMGEVSSFLKQANEDKIHDLIILGATYCVWPAGTASSLTYPWGLDGTGIPVRFRTDLSEFTKRRIIEILKKSGKLRNPNLFD
jgi:hypothetical protein